MDKLNIVDFGLNSMSMEYKREILYKMSLSLQKVHESGGYVTDFDPESIYIDEDSHYPSFSMISLLKLYENPNGIKQANLLLLADLAFCLYLPDYNLSNGLLNAEVIATRFEDFKEYFPEEDVTYYRSIFTMDYSNSNEVNYYNDYVDKMISNQASTTSNTNSLVKSTPEGRAFASNEAAFANNVVIVVSVVLIVLAIIFFGIYFVGRFG